MGFANTDSNRMGVNPQIDGLAQALMNRVGSRFGMQPGRGLELSQRPNMPTPTQKPQPQASMPQPTMDQAPAIGRPTVGGNRPRSALLAGLEGFRR